MKLALDGFDLLDHARAGLPEDPVSTDALHFRELGQLFLGRPRAAADALVDCRGEHLHRRRRWGRRGRGLVLRQFGYAAQTPVFLCLVKVAGSGSL